MSKRIMSRRRLLQSLGAAGLTGMAGCGGDGGTDTTTTSTTTSPNGDDTTTTTTTSPAPSNVTIGVLEPLSTDLQYYGQQSLWGFLSGLAYKGGTDPPTDPTTGSLSMTVGETDYELLIRDTQFSADQAQTLATDLVQNQDVDMLVGTTSSGSASRVINTVVQASGVDIPFMVGPAASASITSASETCDPNVFRASENTAMDAQSGGRYVARETDVSRVYLFGADYSFGHAVVNNYESVLQAEGVEIVGKRFVNSGHSEWEGLLQNAEDAGADGMVAGFTVATLPAIFTTYLQGDYSYRVFGGWATRITLNVVGGILQNQLGTPLTQEKLEGTGLGPFTTRYHWNQYDNDINSSFVDMYTNAYGVVPDLFTSGMFTAGSAIVQAVNEAGSTDAAALRNALTGMTVTDTPKGENAYTFQEYNNQARSAMTVANGLPTQDEYSDSWGAPIQPAPPLQTIPASETTIPQDSEAMNCSL